ncbi:hypothetical protein TUN199_09409 [Pyrenophora tritici-repentis]|nr:hypothetical protein Alg130_09360 [Pyrenophora tritici-repentis]KAI0578239.1 hypothetical protein Alg215_06431 [Pyrenophora tritici-repentis]KAI0606417.1 hypothetical protein TUN205_09322 [Pyrenophora tritici-repentis]KAI0618584.1 hypothetical protein TUN199_09409 [Pyrenophora tritici-repentis]
MTRIKHPLALFLTGNQPLLYIYLPAASIPLRSTTKQARHRTTRSSANAMSSQDAKDKEIARLKTELAKATVVYEQAQKQLESISTLHRTQAVTISSQIDTIRELIRLHPEDIPDIQGRAKAAEEERLRIVKDSSVKQETPASPE